MPPSTSHRAPARKGTASVNELADKLASGLTLKDKRKVASKPSVESRRTTAMIAVNSASKSLMDLVESGWKYRKDGGRSASNSDANSSAAAAATHLSVLRQLCPGDVDIERAAAAVLSKLVSLEMYQVALPALAELHTSLHVILAVDAPPPSADRLQLISLPIPASPPIDTTLLKLISTYFLHALTITTQLPQKHAKLADILRTEYTLLSWLPILSPLPSKDVDFLLTRSFSLLTKFVSPQSPPQEAFYIRMHAVCYLAHTSPGVVKANAFWEQPLGAASAYMKALLSTPTTSSVQDEAAAVIVQAFSQIMAIVGRGTSAPNLMQGKSFISFCEYWMELANRTNNTALLDHIVTLIHKAPSLEPSSDATAASSAFNTAHFCATLTRTTALLEKPDHSNVSLDETITYLTALHRHLQHVRDPAVFDGKVERTMERLRRVGITVIESTTEQDKPELMLVTIVSVLEDMIRLKPDRSLVNKALDTLFALSRVQLKVSLPKTYVVAHGSLSRASRLLEDARKGLEPPETANFMRCISGSFHNIGGQLYQAGRHASAISFLEEGCKLGTEALLLYKSTTTGDLGDPWTQLSNQLYRRWQLLALCSTKIGDRKPGYDAFVQCIQTFPYDTTGFSRLATTTPLQELFELSPALKELSSIIDKVTYQGLCDLMIPGVQVSLHTTVDDPHVGGALLERQIDSLEAFLHKSVVKAVLPVLAKTAVDLYTACGLHVQRARVLVKSLALGYTCGPDGFHSVGTPESIAADVEQSLKDVTSEVPLGVYAPQYRALAHVWRAMHAHRCADEQQLSIIGDCTERVCDVLRALVEPPPPPPPAPAPAKATKRKAVAAAARRKAAPAAKPTRKRAPAPEPVTPKSKPRKALQDVPINTTVAASSSNQDDFAPAFDQPAKLLDVLQSLVHVLGFLSLLVPKVNLLDVMRRIAERCSGTGGDLYVSVTVQLASEYVRLGRNRRATKLFNEIMPVVKQGKLSPDIAIAFFLRFAEASSVSENFEQSSSLYEQAAVLAGRYSEDKSIPPLQRAQLRINRTEQVAMAFNIFASIQLFRNDVAGSLNALIHSLRLWNRAFDGLARLQPAAIAPKPSEDDPFQDSPRKEAATPSIVESSQPTQTFARRMSMTSSGWRISEGLLFTFLALSRVYVSHGSVREAQFFAQQAEELARALNAPAMAARALTRKAELLLQQGQLEDGYESLAQALELIEEATGVEVVDIHRLRGRYEEEDADEIYILAEDVLQRLEQTFGVFDGVAFGPRRSSGGPEVIVPDLLTKLLRDRIWRLRDDSGSKTETLLENLLSLPATSETKAEENSLIAKLTLHGIYKRFRSDMFLSSLPESTIALPLGTSGIRIPALPGSSQDILKNLDITEELFWANLELTCRRGSVAHVREAAVRLALIRAFQASLGKEGADGPLLTTNLLDAASAITLRREMCDAILHKFQMLDLQDDLDFPSTTPKPEAPKTRRVQSMRRSSDSESEDDEAEGPSLKDFWKSVQKRYQERILDPSSLNESNLTSLPESWSVVHINVTDDMSTMFIARQYGGASRARDLVFCVPLKGRRDGGNDEDEHLTFQDVMAEFEDIIQCANETSKAAVNVKSEEARTQWWKDRAALDTRLKDLLENMEFCWLGAFKTILSRRPQLSHEEISLVRASFDKAFQRGLHLQDKKTKQKAIGHRKMASDYQTPNRVTLDDALMECFSNLSIQCRDEELEDLVYFMLDLYQFHGVPVAIAEIDVDQVVVDLRTALEEHIGRMRRRKAEPVQDDHIFLVLDKDIQGLPWENIPILRGRSVSRIPNVDFLLDRVEFAKWRKGGDASGPIDRAVVNPRKGYFILNPSGDLKRTEDRFQPWAKDMESVGWQGITGRAPSEMQFVNALRDNDLVVYLGHGGGEQYIRSHKIRHLPKCAAVMLWGCSSGFLRDMGEFDRIGSPYNYMLSGCPTLVANLWDVTDRDIDKFSQAVFDRIGLESGRIRERALGDRPGTSIVAAVAQSREVCKLKYLTGAAPVVYGIPFYL